MKKKIIFVILLSAFLLTGCGDGAVSDSGSVPNEETEHSPENTEASPVGGDIPSESIAPETSSQAAVTAASTAAPDGGVVLSEPEYKKLMEMVTFDGEFVNLSDIGAVITKAELSDFIPEDVNYSIIGAQDEYVYFQLYDYSEPDKAMIFLAEYNTEAAEFDKVWSGENIYIVYADKDYIVYAGSGAYRIYFRGEGKDLAMPEMYSGTTLYRVGQSFFFNYSDRIYDEKTDYSYDVNAVCRYAPLSDLCHVVCDGGILFGGSDFGLCIGLDGSMCYSNPIYDPNVKGEYPFGAASMSMAGEYPTYNILWNSDALGDKYEVGFFPHYLVRKPLLRTQYKTDVYFTAVTKDKAAVVLLQADGEYGCCAAVIDTSDKKAALLDGLGEYSGVYSSGSYVHIINYQYEFDGQLVTINTSALGE